MKKVNLRNKKNKKKSNKNLSILLYFVARTQLYLRLHKFTTIKIVMSSIDSSFISVPLSLSHSLKDKSNKSQHDLLNALQLQTSSETEHLNNLVSFKSLSCLVFRVWFIRKNEFRTRIYWSEAKKKELNKKDWLHKIVIFACVFMSRNTTHQICCCCCKAQCKSETYFIFDKHVERYTAKKSVWAKRCETILLHETRIPNARI